MTRANFNENGLAIGQNQTNMTYLYGLSDFFTVMFEDTDKVNLLLEASTEGPAEVYSKFLQLTSTLSIAGIQETLGVSIELVILQKTAAVQGGVNLYTLPKTITNSRYIANRPFLPTVTLEQGVDYQLEVSTNGTVNIRFAADITTLGFSTNINSSGVQQFALWFVDAEIDERLISSQYGNLIGVTPENSTDAFYNFIYGLYYVYINGPTLDLVRKGLNLVLGIPLARANETVLSIQQYLNTDQYIVITSQNQYLIPFGIAPSVNVGDNIVVGQELAQWVVISDYLSDGDWWINLQIPESIIPQLPPGQKDRFATAGSHFDYLMRTYLKKHTFLVNVNVSSFENLQSFAQLSDIIHKVKPSYTQPIYVWTVDSGIDTLTISDDASFSISVLPYRCERLQYPIERMHRDNTTDQLTRSCPIFIRSNVPLSVTKTIGTDPYLTGTQTGVNGGVMTGFLNPQSQFRTNTTVETSWLTGMFQRNHDQIHIPRSIVGFNRSSQDTTLTNGQAVTWYNQPAGYKVIPLYITRQFDIASKCLACNTDIPPINQWVFTIFNLSYDSTINGAPINVLAVDDGGTISAVSPLVTYFNTLFFRGSTVGYLGPLIPDIAFTATYAPSVSDITGTDYIMGVRIIEDVVGIYWVTANQNTKAPYYFPVGQADSATITYSMPITRGHQGIGTPFYTLRGADPLDYSQVAAEIDAAAVNDQTGYNNAIAPSTYTDKYNPTLTVNRGGTVIVHAQELN